MRKFARTLIAAHMESARKQMARARENQDEETVHDLRVSFRRLTAALRSFRPLFSPLDAEQTNGTLRPIMKLAGEVRNRDIALGLAKEAGIEPGTTLVKGLRRQRTLAARRLAKALAAHLDGAAKNGGSGK